MIVKSVVNSVRTKVYLVLLKCLVVNLVDLFTHFQAELVKLHLNFFYVLIYLNLTPIHACFVYVFMHSTSS